MQAVFFACSTIPKIGFASHFRAENYRQIYDRNDGSIELVYIKSGDIVADLYGKSYDIPQGSVLVLPRCLPIVLTTKEPVVQMLCSVQLFIDAPLSFIDERPALPMQSKDGMLLPFITLPCSENESIKNELYSIISTVSSLGEAGMQSAAFCAMGIMAKLDRMFRQEFYAKHSKASLWEYKIKNYVSAHIHKPYTLSELAQAMGKTPNYLNSVFKQVTGIGIRQYTNREKVRTICELLEIEELSFKKACASVAIEDTSYGYRLFKKHTGMTPSEFMEGKRIGYIKKNHVLRKELEL